MAACANRSVHTKNSYEKLVFLNGSIASIKGFPAFGVYSASKAAVRSFARTWLIEPKGVELFVDGGTAQL